MPFMSLFGGVCLMAEASMRTKISQQCVAVESLEQRLQFSDAPDLIHSTGSLSIPREAMGATSVGDRAFFAGGYVGFPRAGDAFTDVVDVYNAKTGIWSTAHLSQATAAETATHTETIVFFPGGFLKSVKAIDIYDSVTSTWSIKSFRESRHWVQSATVIGQAVFISSVLNASGVPIGGAVDIFDATARRWSERNALTFRELVAIGTKILSSPYESPTTLVFDGITHGWSTIKVPVRGLRLEHPIAVGTKVFFRVGGTIGVIYDTVAGTWTQIATPRLGEQIGQDATSAATVGTKIIFASGPFFPGGLPVYANVVNVYDSVTGQWSTAPISVPRGGISATTVGNQALFAGGAVDIIGPTQAFTPQSAVDIFTDTAPSPVLSGGLTGNIGHRNQVTIINTGDAALAGPYGIRLYASLDRTLNGAILVGTRGVTTPLPAGSSATFGVRTILPKDTPAGTYHLLAAISDGTGHLTPIAAEDATFRVGRKQVAAPANARPAKSMAGAFTRASHSARQWT